MPPKNWPKSAQSKGNTVDFKELLRMAGQRDDEHAQCEEQALDAMPRCREPLRRGAQLLQRVQQGRRRRYLVRA
jgi:hypothetical protein